MLFLLALLLAVLFSFVCRKALKKHAVLFYIAAAAVSVAVAVWDFHGVPAPMQNYVIGLFSRGAFATGLWCVVMWIGALPNGSAMMKALMPVRGELSIFAAILTLGHNFGFGKTYFVRMFTNPGSMKPTQLTAGILSLVMLAIMIPLTILSIPSVRKKMTAKRWKKIQRTAYLFYALIYLHVMILFLPSAQNGKVLYQVSVIVYSLVFLGYAACRIRKAIIRKKPEKKKRVLCLSIAGVVCGMIFVLVLLLPKGTEENIPVVDTDTESTEISEESYASVNDTAETDEDTKTGEETEKVQRYKDGTYTATAYGYDGDITVSVIIVEDVITAITAQSAEEDPWYFEQAEKLVIEAILAGQATEVDAVSGATYSSKGIMQAVENALEQAKNGD